MTLLSYNYFHRQRFAPRLDHDCRLIVNDCVALNSTDLIYLTVCTFQSIRYYPCDTPTFNTAYVADTRITFFDKQLPDGCKPPSVVVEGSQEWSVTQ